MAHKIPKIQYFNVTKTSTTTNGSPVITGVTVLADIRAGMLAVGAGIPVGALVVSSTPTTITLDQNATASASVSVEYYFEIIFDFPPIENGGEAIDSKEHTTVSISGVVQTSVDYLEGVRTLEFSYLTQAIKDLMDLFYTTHAGLGLTFKYFDDKTVNVSIDYELKDLKYPPKKLAPRGPNAYVWSITLKFRRLVP